MNKFDKELIDKIREAGKPFNFFTLKLEFNGKIILAKRDFPAGNLSPESIHKAQLQFMITDFSRKVIEEIRRQERASGNTSVENVNV